MFKAFIKIILSLEVDSMEETKKEKLIKLFKSWLPAIVSAIGAIISIVAGV